jgi:hypothetical protein
MADLEALSLQRASSPTSIRSLRCGRPPLISDAELVALAVCQAAIGINSDRLQRVLPGWFAHVADKSQYNRRLRGLVELISVVQQRLAGSVVAYLLVVSSPIERRAAMASLNLLAHQVDFLPDTEQRFSQGAEHVRDDVDEVVNLEVMARAVLGACEDATQAFALLKLDADQRLEFVPEAQRRSTLSGCGGCHTRCRRPWGAFAGPGLHLAYRPHPLLLTDIPGVSARHKSEPPFDCPLSIGPGRARGGSKTGYGRPLAAAS